MIKQRKNTTFKFLIIFLLAFVSFSLIYPSLVFAQTVFPANGSYSLSSTVGTISADFSYAKPVPLANFILWPARSFDTILGNFGKGLFGAAIAAPGPAFRWDVSDPLNIKGPEVVELTSGPSGGHGPISNIGWAHLDHFGGAAVAESPEGDARYAEHLGTGRDVAVVWDGATGQGTFGGITWSNVFGSSAIIHTAADKFFSYGHTRAGIIGTWDLSDLNGSATYDMKSIGTIAWSAERGRTTLSIPGKGDFLLGLSAGSYEQTGTLRTGKIDANTGRLTNKKSYTGIKTFSADNYRTNLQAVAYNGKGYIFSLEEVKFENGDAITGSLPSQMTIGVYVLNPSDSSAIKINTLTVKDLGRNSPFKYKLIGSEDGSISPLLIVPADKVVDAWDGSADLRVYNLKKILSEPETIFTSGNVDFFIPKTGPAQNATVKTGDIVINQLPFNAILVKQVGKTYLNLFRNTYIVLEGAYLGNDYPYGLYGGITVDATASGPLQVDGMGIASIRADKIDVTALVTGGSSTTSTGNGCAPGYLFSTTTGKPCTTSTTVSGCAPGNLFNTLTGARCLQTSTPPVTTVGMPPVIGNVTGPTTVLVSQEGTWTVTATDPNNDDLSWSVDWGDGRSAETCKLNPPLGTSQNWTYTFSHSWTTVGTKNVTFYVGDCHGNTVGKGITVLVAN